ncbi:MAG: hypothetical protein QM817_15130 [Archangium sp.]
MTRALGAVLLLAVSGCVTAQVAVPPAEVATLERTLLGERRFLRSSMYQTPFFGDATKRLLTPTPPDLVRFLENPNGKPMTPGAVEKTWPVNTPVKILKVEFPSAWTMTERVLYTPRTLVWIYVELDGAARGAAPGVIVLRPGIQSQQEFIAELDRHLSREDLTRQLDAMNDAVRDAVKSKAALNEMTAEQLEMAWGFPESKKIELDGAVKKETWRWGEGKRTATLVDGRVTAFTP